MSVDELDELPLLEELSLDGVELEDEEDGVALDPLVDEDESLLLELGGVALLLELELLGLVELEGGVALLELELLGLVLGLALIDPELEPLLEDGLDLLPIVELELDDGDVVSRDAPVLEPGPLLQPYRLPTATATGSTTSAVFFRILISRAPLDNVKGD